MKWKQKKGEGARLHFSIFSKGSLGLCKSCFIYRYKIVLEKLPLPLYLQKNLRDNFPYY